MHFMRITVDTCIKSKSMGKISKINLSHQRCFMQPTFTIMQYHTGQNPRATSVLRRILSFQQGDLLCVALRHFSFNNLPSASLEISLTVLVMSFAAIKNKYSCLWQHFRFSRKAAVSPLLTGHEYQSFHSPSQIYTKVIYQRPYYRADRRAGPAYVWGSLSGKNSFLVWNNGCKPRVNVS